MSINATKNIFVVLKTGHYLVNCVLVTYINIDADTMQETRVGFEWYPTVDDYDNYTNVIEYWGPMSVFISNAAQTDIMITSEINRIMYLVAGNVLGGLRINNSVWGGGSISKGDSPEKSWQRVVRLD